MNYFVANLKGVVQPSTKWSGNCWKISLTVDRVAKMESARVVDEKKTEILLTDGAALCCWQRCLVICLVNCYIADTYNNE